ncbi:porin [Mesosutterella sp. OilRF-GAM-744-9]|uniref:Porin n=1 Tax=Mesosutterella porci TaxID=2915351 RepID=A0ABS9MSC3_9BURK|nr:porin [Mesosutterella sp. oilRF-744-WT-GAM-9]MCG5031526.1 porin [Mesosutterella sp. oilRF-744-WT-GAM-9]
MRKSLVAAACAAAFGLGAAAAQAAPSVSVYGAIDEYIAVNNDSGTVSSALSSGGSTGSYFGFKGEETLAVWGGTKAVFKLESGFLADDGTYAQSYAGNTNRIFHREAWVGLQNRHFGQISFGRQYTPHFLTWAMSDVNGLSLGTASSPFFYPGPGATMGGSDPTNDDLVRRNNSIFWATPSYAGFSAMAYMAFGEADKTSSSNGNVYNIALQYAKGPLFIMGSALYQNLSTPTPGFYRTGRGHDQYYELAMSYDFGFTKPAIQFEWKEGDDTAARNDFWLVQIGTTTPMLGGRLNTTAAYYKNRTLKKSDAYSFGARFDYDLSKRTMLYAGVEALIQEDNAQFAIEAGPDSAEHFATSAPGNDTQQVFVGIRHRF